MVCVPLKHTHKIKTYVCAFDLHYPLYHKPSWLAMLNYLSKNKVDGFIAAGDFFDNLEISHHTRGKPLFRERGAYDKNTEGFRRNILEPLEKVLGPKTEKVFIIGNHERFEQDLIEEQPELEGTIEHVKLLSLEKRGWKIIPLGHGHKLGKLHVIHGEVLTGIGNQAGMYPSRKAVELYAGNVLAGHTHSPQSFTKVSPVEVSNKWMGTIAPALCETNPSYLKNRGTAWTNGFCIVEVQDTGNFNLYTIIVSDGVFSYGGKLYKGV